MRHVCTVDDYSASPAAAHVQAAVALVGQVLDVVSVHQVFMVAAAARLELNLRLCERPLLRQAAQLHMHTAGKRQTPGEWASALRGSVTKGLHKGSHSSTSTK